MSKTIKNKKPLGFDFWSKRCFGCLGASFGPISKMITKRKERQRNRNMIYKAMKDRENYEKRFPGE